jgi:FMN phosphatase YigB (HAD superfamily)
LPVLPSAQDSIDQGGAMRRQAITFDFHNTLVHCDEWFELEVRDLPTAFARWHEVHHGPLGLNGATAGLGAAYRSLRRAIIDHGHELTAENSLAAVFGQAGIKVDQEILETGVRALMSKALDYAHEVPGAVYTVRELARRDIPIGVVSSAVYHPFLEWSLERLEIGHLICVVVTSASCGYYKSKPEIYWHALDALNADPATSLHVGDSLRFDVGGASRAGMRTVWLDHGSADRSDIEPDLAISTLNGAAPRLVELLSSR